MLYDTIRADLTAAMKERDETRVTVLRSLLAGFTNEAVAQKRKPDEKLSDEDALLVLQRSIKQHRDSIEQFSKAGRTDLAKNEEAELAILEAYQPEMMSREEIDELAKAKKDELGVSDTADAGKLMGALMKELKGKADGADVKAAVDALFV